MVKTEKFSHPHKFSIYPKLTDKELPAALALWQAGKNTAEIAEDIRGTIYAESAVANSLAAFREKQRELA